MNIDKNTILNLLHNNGQHAEADQAAQTLPDQVDTEQHAGLLSKLGLNIPDLIAKFTGGGGGGLGGMLSGLGGGNTASSDAKAGPAVDEEGEATGGAQSGGLGGLLGSLGDR